MSTFLAGEKVRASELNSYVLLTARATASLVSTSDTTLSDVTGLAIALEANATYIMDGYLTYGAASGTPDCKVAFTVPAGTTGHWSLFGLSTAAASPGNLDTQYATSLATALAVGTDASITTLSCRPAGYIVTAGTAGNLQLQAAQNTSSATAMTVALGSWIRVQRVA